MPSHFDNTYNHIFSAPEYDRDQDKNRYEKIREVDEVLEMSPARLANQSEEDDYVDWLAADFRSDPWLTYRFRKYTANPKRIPWKNNR